MRIAFLIKSLAEGGGAEKVLTEVAEALQERGHDIVVASFDGDSADFYPLGSTIARERLGVGDARRRTGPLDLIRKIRAARDLLTRVKPDAAIGFMHSAFVPLTIGGMGTGIPVIASEHISYDHYRNRPGQRALVAAAARLSAAMTITLESVGRGFPSGIRRKMTAVPNPLAMTPKRTRRPRASKALLFVANFRAQKAHNTLIDAFALLADAYPDWSLRLVGDGELRSAIEEQVKQLGLGSRVTFTGSIGDVADEYARAEIFVIPSLYESFGLATAEALASGVPVVGFADCAGTNELVQPGVNGILVRGSNRASALAEGLSTLMSDAILRKQLGSAGPATVQQYSLEATTDRWEALIETVVRKRA